jgi:AGZA family xanthine/uracil permease-like MFS transporter
MILAALGVALIERQFAKAGGWSLVAALLSAVGIIHAYEVTPGGVVSRFGIFAAGEFVWVYLALALGFFAVALAGRKQSRDVSDRSEKTI